MSKTNTTATAPYVSPVAITFMSSYMSLEDLRAHLLVWYPASALVSQHSTFGCAAIGVVFSSNGVTMEQAMEAGTKIAESISNECGNDPYYVQALAYNIASEIVADARDFANHANEDYCNYEEAIDDAAQVAEYEALVAQYGVEGAEIFLYGVDYDNQYERESRDLRERQDDLTETFEEALERRAMCVR